MVQVLHPDLDTDPLPESVAGLRGAIADADVRERISAVLTALVNARTDMANV
jgi:hypothetical protein